MKNYQIKELETIFNKLVEYANKKIINQNLSLENKDDYIECIHKLIKHYFLCIDPYKVLYQLDSSVHIIYNSKKYGKKVYRLFCPGYENNKFYIPNNILDINCPIVDFTDIINYYKNGINIIYNENPKQKVKRPQK